MSGEHSNSGKATFRPGEDDRLDIQRIKTEAGMLRWLIGTGDHARINGAFLFIFGMIFASGLLVWTFGREGLEYCKTTTIPLITAGLGYFAASGRKSSSP